MGYYSQVAFVLTEQANLLFEEKIKLLEKLSLGKKVEDEFIKNYLQSCITDKDSMFYNPDITLEKLKDSVYKEIKEFLDSCTTYVHPTTKSKLYYFDNIKWYFVFNEVKFIHQFLAIINRSDYYQVIIGEERDDIQLDGDFYDNDFDLYPERYISFIEYTSDNSHNDVHIEITKSNLTLKNIFINCYKQLYEYFKLKFSLRG